MPPIAKKIKRAANQAAAAAAKPADEVDEDRVISGQLDKKIKKSQARIDRERGVVIIRHLPHGFFEEQLKNYFQQFGKVTRLRLARSKRTGGSKGFAFVEFEFPEVAKVAAETMDNYLMFQRVVKAAYIPPENQQYNYFKSSIRKVANRVGKPIYVSGRTACIQRKAAEHNNWTDDAYQKRIASNLRKLRKLKEKYVHLGIDFDNFTVKPNIQSAAEKKEKDKQNETEDKSTPGSLLLLKKRKQPTQQLEKEVKKPKTEKPAKAEKIIELKDLLENTLNEEDSSDDEEFIPTLNAADDDEETSDEESYGILKELNSETEVNKPDVKVTDDEDEDQSPQPKRKGKSFEKSRKVDRMAELIKRKPNLGGIQKSSKKNLKDKTKSAKPSNVNKLKVAAAKEIKQQGHIKQLKKADLKKRNKKQRV